MRQTLLVPELRVETVIEAAADACFALSVSVDAHTASMRSSAEQAIAGTTSGQMKLGNTVTWRARHFGIHFQMTAAMKAYDFPDRFVDEQQNGPFKSWWHEHWFVRHGDGTTVMVDTVRFSSPFGPLGATADRAVLIHYMPNLIRRRNDWLRQTLESRR